MRNQRLLLKAGGRMLIICEKEIDWLESEGHYVRIHFRNETVLLRAKISQMENELDPHDFLRINRSIIVHLDFVRELKPSFRGAYRTILKDGTVLTLSPEYRKRLYSMFARSGRGASISGKQKRNSLQTA
jgi:two-component system, LytTR family, response regulator